MKIDAAAPIGAFDSGVGGLSILKEIRYLMPQEKLIYVADSAYAPYGRKDDEAIFRRCQVICDFLIQRHCKLIVVACNTATAACIDRLRQTYSIPIVGVEPALKPAAMLTQSNRIGLLATESTLKSRRLLSLMTRFISFEQKLYPVGCPGFVELVEKGKFDSSDVYDLAQPVLSQLITNDVDSLVLGCTHFPFIQPVLEDIVGSRMHIINPAAAIATEVLRQLNASNLAGGYNQQSTLQFITSADPTELEPVVKRLWRTAFSIHKLRT
ncbi:glutamate racemase [Alteromonas sp. ASW11-130]|uniref:glutamate racemase n=1 Tax=Alteromonas sp. ASW11-130 TaxID=3015775 RepID=UPI0022425297|nr:glutamate racemase [Alteromonas sp. ASW11-130]MCW8090648.1 glutamate racemase [Alteromonas sp. ASW11-130]